MEFTKYHDGKKPHPFLGNIPAGTIKANHMLNLKNGNPWELRDKPIAPLSTPEQRANQRAMNSACTLFMWTLIGVPFFLLILGNARDWFVNSFVGIGAVLYSLFLLCFVVPPVGIAVVVILAALAFGSSCCCGGKR